GRPRSLTRSQMPKFVTRTRQSRNKSLDAYGNSIFSTGHIHRKLLRTIGYRCVLKEVARSESPWPASYDPHVPPVKSPCQRNLCSASRTLEPLAVRPERRASLPLSAGGAL